MVHETKKKEALAQKTAQMTRLLLVLQNGGQCSPQHLLARQVLRWLGIRQKKGSSPFRTVLGDGKPLTITVAVAKGWVKKLFNVYIDIVKRDPTCQMYRAYLIELRRVRVCRLNTGLSPSSSSQHQSHERIPKSLEQYTLYQKLS